MIYLYVNFIHYFYMRFYVYTKKQLKKEINIIAVVFSFIPLIFWSILICY